MDIENGDRFSNDEGQFQLESTIDFLLLTPCDVGADGFRHAFDGFGGEIQAGEQLELLTPMLEGRFLPHQGLHPAHTGRETGLGDIEFGIGGRLTLVTVGTQVIRSNHAGFSQHCQHGLGAHVHITWRALRRDK